jgi:hypothetical protein
LARVVTMLSTRPAVARSSGGRSPNSLPVTSSRAADLAMAGLPGRGQADDGRMVV